MEITAQRPSIIYRPLGITLTILATVVLWLLFSGNPTTLALLTIAGLFLFGLKKPLWAVGALMVSQLTITSYMIDTPFGFTISLRLLLMILTLAVVWYSSAERKIDIGPNARRIIIPVIIIIVISAASNLINSGFDYAFADFRNTLIGLLIVILIPAVTHNLRDLKTLCGVVFIVIMASATIGLMQNYGFLGMNQATLIPNFLLIGNETRVPGMAETELELAYVLTTTLIVVLSVYVARGLSAGNHKLLFLSILLMAPTLYFTYTRSALLALGFGLIALFLFLKTRTKGVIILVTLIVVVIVIEMTGVLSNQYLGGRSETAQEESSVSRQILWQTGIAIAVDNPILGIGGNQYTSVSPQYAESVDPALLEWEQEQYWGYSTLGSEAVHNDFLYFWISYGTLALIAYVWLLVSTLHSLINSHRVSKNRFLKGLAIGLAAAVVAYSVNAFYHNLLTTLPLLWVLTGFSLAIGKLVKQDKTRLIPNKG